MGYEDEEEEEVEEVEEKVDHDSSEGSNGMGARSSNSTPRSSGSSSGGNNASTTPADWERGRMSISGVKLFAHLVASPLVDEGGGGLTPSPSPPPPPPIPGGVDRKSSSGSLSAPTPIPELAYQKEMSMLHAVLRGTGKRLRFRSEFATAHTFLTSAAESTVLHFTGHGTQGSIAIEDEHGGMHLVPSGPLRRLLDEDTVPRVVFVSACFSESVVGEAFVAAGVPHVVAVSESSMILDQKALDFTHTFYTLLLRGSSVRHAFDAAEMRVGLSKDHSAEAQKFQLLPKGQDHSERPFENLDDGHYIDLTPRPSPSSCWPVSTYFVGRQVEVHEVVKQVVKGARAVTIVGPSGIGKTQVALKACSFLRERNLVEEIIFIPFPVGASRNPSSSFSGENLSELRPQISKENLGLGRAQESESRELSTLVYTAFAEALGLDAQALLEEADPLEALVQRSRKRLKLEGHSKPRLLVFDGALPQFMSAVYRQKVTLQDTVEAILARIPHVQILLTIVSQVGISGEKVVKIGPLDSHSSASLFVKSAPRDVLVAELRGGNFGNVGSHPLEDFATGTLVANMGGHPGVILGTSKLMVEGFSLLESEYELLSSIPREYQRYRQKDADFFYLQNLLDEADSVIEEAPPDGVMIPRYELPAWEPLIPDCREEHGDHSTIHSWSSSAEEPKPPSLSASVENLHVSRFISSTSSAWGRRGCSDAWLKAVRATGLSVWQYVRATSKQRGPNLAANSSCTKGRGPPSPSHQASTGDICTLRWADIRELGLKPFFRLHVGTERPLSAQDWMAMESDKSLWGSHVPPSKNGGTTSKNAFFRYFWPWFQAMVAMLKASLAIWNSTEPTFILGFSKEQVHSSLSGAPRGTFALKVSLSEPASLVFSYVHDDAGLIKNVLAEILPNGRYAVKVSRKRTIRTLGDHIMTIPSLLTLFPNHPKKLVARAMQGKKRLDCSESGNQRALRKLSSDKNTGLAAGIQDRSSEEGDVHGGGKVEEVGDQLEPGLTSAGSLSRREGRSKTRSLSEKVESHSSAYNCCHVS